MPAGAEFGPDWEKLLKKIESGEFEREVKLQFGRATKLNGLRFARTVRERIRAGKYRPNRPFTTFMKQSGIPLVDNADLLNSISTVWSEDKPLVSEVGALKSTRWRGRKLNLAKMLHDGFTIKVTRASLRWMALALKLGPTAMKRRPPRRRRRQRRATEVVRTVSVKGRPYLRGPGSPLEDPEVQKQMRETWFNALVKVFR